MNAPRDDRRPENRLDPQAGTPPQGPPPEPPHGQDDEATVAHDDNAPDTGTDVAP